MEKKKIVILGAGFAGLKLARKLNNNPHFSVTLIDRYNYHQFQPLFYQVATAGINASDISFPIRKVFQGSKNVSVRLAEVTAIKKKLILLKPQSEIFLTIIWLLPWDVPQISLVINKLRNYHSQ